MAIEVTVTNDFGEVGRLYVRLNNAGVSNHGVASTALFRGFTTREAYTEGYRYQYEREIEFNADVTQSVWPQAYAAYKALLQVEGPSDAIDVFETDGES
ncbi:hypothetical protein [Serratia grimesii]|uniref:hypothetical protein n=1 Tax=Serratia grimesii TaxID=82995 RepID=UPI00224070BE|nr:hypothetical protein [Serratia grimesii]